MDFSLSGNVGVTYTPDLANRCLFINLFLDIENANSRKFKNPLLQSWVSENRGLILSALYSLVTNWIEKGKPDGKVPFASFPEWAKICGGIMEAAGYGSPCVIDEKSISQAGDQETSDMKVLFEICYKYQNASIDPLKKEKIIQLIKNEEDIFQAINFEERSGKIQFGLILKRYLGRILSGIKLEIRNINLRGERQEYIFRRMEEKLKKNKKNPDE
jgi:hypothetical protein